MSNLIIEKAKLKNLKDLIYLLFEDDLGKERENLRNISMNKYKKAFTKIIKDSNNEIFIMILNDQIIGMMQLTFIPGLSMQGMTRCQIESVRIKKEYRDRGYGSKLINKGIEIAKINKCGLIQLTSNKKRKKAINFYKKLGFLSLHLVTVRIAPSLQVSVSV